MPTTIQKKLYNSVTVFWLNRDLLKKKVKKAVQDLIDNNPEVCRVVLFGSVAEERAVPSSDVDILITTSSFKDNLLDRPLAFHKYFRNMGLGADIFIYTESELATESIPLAQTALKHGKLLFARED